MLGLWEHESSEKEGPGRQTSPILFLSLGFLEARAVLSSNTITTLIVMIGIWLFFKYIALSSPLKNVLLVILRNKCVDKFAIV